MKPRILSLAAAALLAAATQAQAQQTGAAAAARPAAQPDPTQAAATAAQANPAGPAIPGVCVVDAGRVSTTSTVGQYMLRRMEELRQQVVTELNTAGTTAQNEVRALEGQRAALGDQNFLNQRNQIVARLAQLEELRNAELQETAGRAQNNIMQQARPIFVEVFNARRCSLLLHSDAVLLRGDSMDVTQDVITRLNAKLTQFPIDRVQIQLQAPQGAAAPAGAPPVAQTPAPARPAQGPTR